MVATLDPADAVIAPGWGVQVVRVTPISLVRIADAGQVDCPDPVGSRLRAWKVLYVLISKTLCQGFHTGVWQLCGQYVCRSPLALPVAIMY